jgi:Arc/MetJ-type ribon-helix-helix transcriptional regulator
VSSLFRGAARFVEDGEFLTTLLRQVRLVEIQVSLRATIRNPLGHARAFQGEEAQEEENWRARAGGGDALVTESSSYPTCPKCGAFYSIVLGHDCGSEQEVQVVTRQEEDGRLKPAGKVKRIPSGQPYASIVITMHQREIIEEFIEKGFVLSLSEALRQSLVEGFAQGIQFTKRCPESLGANQRVSFVANHLFEQVEGNRSAFIRASIDAWITRMHEVEAMLS